MYASAQKADFVEFDVQLTKDLQCVIYHDCTTLTLTYSIGNLDEFGYKIPVNMVTLQEFLHFHSKIHPRIGCDVNRIKNYNTQNKTMDDIGFRSTTESNRESNGDNKLIFKGNYQESIQEEFTTLKDILVVHSHHTFIFTFRNYHPKQDVTLKSNTPSYSKLKSSISASWI
jgi:glycerophosphoryl diester phosphodiesterase